MPLSTTLYALSLLINTFLIQLRIEKGRVTTSVKLLIGSVQVDNHMDGAPYAVAFAPRGAESVEGAADVIKSSTQQQQRGGNTAPLPPPPFIDFRYYYFPLQCLCMHRVYCCNTLDTSRLYEQQCCHIVA
jgi:hypothetical protein